MLALLEIVVPLAVPAPIVARKRIDVAAAAASEPPAAEVAPVPRRNTTRLLPESYSAWSSPDASVFVPAFDPVRTDREPGTNVVFAGIASRSTTASAASLPVFETET